MVSNTALGKSRLPSFAGAHEGLLTNFSSVNERQPAIAPNRSQLVMCLHFEDIDRASQTVYMKDWEPVELQKADHHGGDETKSLPSVLALELLSSEALMASCHPGFA